MFALRVGILCVCLKQNRPLRRPVLLVYAYLLVNGILNCLASTLCQRGAAFCGEHSR